MRLKNFFRQIRATGQDDNFLSLVYNLEKLVSKFEPNILVSDIRMPLTDGYSLVRQLRRRSTAQGGNIPALAVTAYSNEEEVTQSLRAGFQLQMAKPIEPIALALAVAVLTGRITSCSAAN